MKLEDYSKYYIQGSDHYLIPKEVFIELFNEMINWKEEGEELKKQLDEVNKKLYLCTLEIPQNVHGKYVSYVDLVNEMYELKKQLEEKIKIGVADHKYASQCEDKVITMETQQQEFVKYLEDEIKACKAVSDLLFNSNKEIKVYKEILNKYKEIIGEK